MPKIIMNGVEYAGAVGPIGPTGMQGDPGKDAYIVQDAMVYSEEEQVIGVWTDGKPLYRKSYVSLVPNGTKSFTIADISDLSIDKEVNFYGSFSVQGGTYDSFRPIAYSDAVGIAVNSNLLTYSVTSAMSGPVQLIVHLEYTKTTDAASSGLKIQPNIYSTEETVVGRWIDGKPVYRKIFVATVSTSTTWTDVATTDDLNVDTVVNLHGITKYGTSANGPLLREQPLPHFRSTSVYSLLTHDRTSSPNNIRCMLVGFESLNNVVTIFFEYTKTTDTATIEV